jgi:hypothetical protein
MIATYSHQSIQRIAEVLKLPQNTTSFNLSVVAGEVVKLQVERVIETAELEAIADLIEDELCHGVLEASSVYYLNGRPLALNEPEPAEYW